MLIGGITICKDKTYKHVRTMSDNKVAFFSISYMINKGESKSQSCNKIAKELQILCAHLKLLISATHLPEIQNTEANRFSREFNEAIQRIWCISTRSILHLG